MSKIIYIQAGFEPNNFTYPHFLIIRLYFATLNLETRVSNSIINTLQKIFPDKKLRVELEK